MHRHSYQRLRWLRFAAGAFALCLMLYTALHTPGGVLVASGQHTAVSHAAHAKQPCLDSPGFDWSVPQAGFAMVSQPHQVQRPLGVNLIAYSLGPREFRLYNRPPPLS